MLRVALKLLAAAGTLLLAVSVWILLPAPHAAVLPLAVGAPELSPILLAAAGVLALGAACYVRRYRTALVALLCAGSTCVLCLIPVIQLPFVLRRFDRLMAPATAEPPAPLPGEVRVVRGVNFSKADGVPLSLDVYQPPARGTFPVIMQIYGGAWQTGSPASQSSFARHFAQRGYVVVAIDYRHAPEWKWPEQIVDVRTAMSWVSEKSPAFDADPTRVVLVGRSSGAQLAMRLAYQEGPSAIRGVVNYYGPIDLAEGWRRPPQPDPLDVRATLEAFIGGTPDQKPEHYRHASPITWVSRTSAPTLSFYGSRDHIVEARFGRMLDAAMRKAGATSILLELPWSEHAFDLVPYGMGGRVALAHTERFIAWAVNR